MRQKQACESHGCNWDSVEGGCFHPDWYMGKVAVVKANNVTAIALTATVDGSNLVGATLSAIQIQAGSGGGGGGGGAIAWEVRNLTVTNMIAVDDVLVTSLDTRGWQGYNSHLLMIRGYSLADGSLLWHR